MDGLERKSVMNCVSYQALGVGEYMHVGQGATSFLIEQVIIVYVLIFSL